MDKPSYVDVETETDWSAQIRRARRAALKSAIASFKGTGRGGVACGSVDCGSVDCGDVTGNVSCGGGDVCGTSPVDDAGICLLLFDDNADGDENVEEDGNERTTRRFALGAIVVDALGGVDVARVGGVDFEWTPRVLLETSCSMSSSGTYGRCNSKPTGLGSSMCPVRTWPVSRDLLPTRQAAANRNAEVARPNHAMPRDSSFA